MIINGTDISTLGVTLLDKNISSNRVSNNYKWDYTLDRPTFFGNALEFKDAQLFMKVESETEQNFHKVMGTIAEWFRLGATVVFPDINLTYTMYLKQKPDYEKLNATTYRLDFVLDSDYGLTDLKVFTSTSNSLQIENNGLYTTPVRIALDVPAMAETLIITGFDYTVELANTPTNAKIVIDTREGTVFINGNNAIEQFKTFHLPSANIGSNIINVNRTCTKLQVDFYERW